MPIDANDVPPMPEPDGAELLYELHAAFGRYVVFPSPQAHDAVTLWCAATHGQPAWEHAPRLTPISPEKRCGKSRLMDVAEAVCHEVLITVNASTAAVVRSISPDDPPTQMVDEADTIFGTKRAAENNEDLRGILNAGHQRNRPYVRWDITTRSREKCPTFAMAMLAAIGDLPDTIMDRAIVIRMRRRAPGEKVTPFRTRRDGPALAALHSRLAQLGSRSHLEELKEAVPVMPVEDRAADTWEPLIAVADLAGGDWPERARAACLAMAGDEPDDDGDGIPAADRPARHLVAPPQLEDYMAHLRRSSANYTRSTRARGRSTATRANRSPPARLGDAAEALPRPVPHRADLRSNAEGLRPRRLD